MFLKVKLWLISLKYVIQINMAIIFHISKRSFEFFMQFVHRFWSPPLQTFNVLCLFSSFSEIINRTTINTTRLPNDVENVVLERDENLAKIEVATLAIIFVVTVIGNTTVLLALWTRRKYAGRKKLSRMYFFILHLSIADLITAFLSVLPQLGWDVTYRSVQKINYIDQ